MNTIESNKLIAEFMEMKSGKKYKLVSSDYNLTVMDRTLYTCEAHELRFHLSWDWLMPVVEKIETLFDGGIEVGIHFGSTIIDQCRDTDEGQLHEPITLFEITMSEGYNFESKIGFTYEAVVKFINWHNNKKS